MELCRSALHHLLYYDTILLLDMFFFGSCYAPRPGIYGFVANVGGIVDDCARHVCLGWRQHQDDEDGRPATWDERNQFRDKASRKVESRSKFWALELQDAVLPSPGFGHVLLGDFSPVLLYQIGSRETRALFNVPEGHEYAKSTQGVKRYIENEVLPNVPASIQPSLAASLEKGRLRCMPNSFLPASKNRTPGVLVAGDALNMRHPLTGGGMTVALNDVVLLSELLHPSQIPDLDDVARVLQQLNVFHWRRKRHTFVINVLAQALYSLFAAHSYYMSILRQGCFEYFKRGGICIDVPASLLGGLAKKPLLLVYHFFVVAFCSIWHLFLSKSLVLLPLTLVDSVVVLVMACWVLFPYIAMELAG
ncbi:Squalene epoxidase [Sporothrix stenoceras]